jgi:alpha-methylacyl-CoA racemase
MSDSGPLHGVRVVELAGLGPSQHGAMLLADLGADVVRVDRPADGAPDRDAARRTLLNRGRRSIALDLKDGDDREVALRLAEGADVLVDPYRPGVLERLGLGPDVLVARNPRLVVARMTGWGQDGPRAGDAGHDIDYIAAAGALHAIGPAADVPVVPLNLVADFGGGGMLLAFGIAAALVERERSGRGQVIDVAMVDGVASLMNFAWQERALARWTPERGSNWLQGAAPWYRAYATADGTFVAVGAYEPGFYATLLERLGLDPAAWPQWDRDRWATLSGVLASIFASRTAEDWERELAGADVCFARVRSLDDVFDDPHMAARGSHVERDGLPQAGVVPRFGRTPGGLGRPAPWPGEHDEDLRAELGG